MSEILTGENSIMTYIYLYMQLHAQPTVDKMTRFPLEH